MKTKTIFRNHNINLLKKIMEDSENMKALKKTIKEIGICLN